MTKERDGKLLYHLTSIDNLESILKNGLQSRSELDESDFRDVADGDIIESRAQHNLENYVPFHFFARSPFDYGVQRARNDEQFILIAVRRAIAEANKWKVVPRHPLAEEGYEILSYIEGMDTIDWDLIAARDYDDRACKVACMAECLSPSSVSSDKFFAIYVKTEECEEAVKTLIKKYGLPCHVNLNSNMFAGG